MPENKRKGMIAVGLMIAVVPFLLYGYRLLVSESIPVLADPCRDCLAVEISGVRGSAGIYFVKRGTTANQLLEVAAISQRFQNDVVLKSGMKLTKDSTSKEQNLMVGEMEASTRLAVGLPIDLNRATQEDLIFIRGIGISTAGKIIELRGRLKRFQDMRQLTAISGINERKLQELQQYLYIEP